MPSFAIGEGTKRRVVTLALEGVDQAVLAQKIERAIDRDRRRMPFGGEPIHDFISAERLMARQQSFEHLAAHLCQPLTARRTQPFGVG